MPAGLHGELREERDAQLSVAATAGPAGARLPHGSGANCAGEMALVECEEREKRKKT